MKKTGLKNRFSTKTRNEWLDWYSCMICGRNKQDVLHHIVSPSSRHYIAGEHNVSVFNSCPIHNYKCHIGNEGWLYNEKNITTLLKKTAEALESLGYIVNENDRDFLRVYAFLYNGKYVYTRGVCP